MMTRFALSILLAMSVLGAGVGKAQSTASAAGPEIAWGKGVDGLKVGLFCESTTVSSEKLPAIYFYVVNEGSKDLGGVIQSGECCMLAVNGQNYFQPSYGGKSSFMPPGRTYGPIPIDIDAHLLIEDLHSRKSDSDAARPKLKRGTNKISVGYAYMNNTVQSGEIQIIRK